MHTHTHTHAYMNVFSRGSCDGEGEWQQNEKRHKWRGASNATPLVLLLLLLLLFSFIICHSLPIRKQPALHTALEEIEESMELRQTYLPFLVFDVVAEGTYAAEVTVEAREVSSGGGGSSSGGRTGASNSSQQVKKLRQRVQNQRLDRISCRFVEIAAEVDSPIIKKLSRSLPVSSMAAVLVELFSPPCWEWTVYPPSTHCVCWDTVFRGFTTERKEKRNTLYSECCSLVCHRQHAFWQRNSLARMRIAAMEG